ncbi:unnamed protein product, partial [Polarella glacialis]
SDAHKLRSKGAAALARLQPPLQSGHSGGSLDAPEARAKAGVLDASRVDGPHGLPEGELSSARQDSGLTVVVRGLTQGMKKRLQRQLATTTGAAELPDDQPPGARRQHSDREGASQSYHRDGEAGAAAAKEKLELQLREEEERRKNTAVAGLQAALEESSVAKLAQAISDVEAVFGTTSSHELVSQ